MARFYINLSAHWLVHKKSSKISIGDTCFICMNEFAICRNCGDMGSGVCRGSGEKILYAWGRNAPKLKLPPGK